MISLKKTFTSSPLRFLTLVLIFLGAFLSAKATHLKGGEITVRRVSSSTLTFEFVVTTYTENNQANQQQDSVFICFGDGSAGRWIRRANGPTSGRSGLPQGEALPDGSYRNIYRTQYTYQAPAPAYKVSVGIRNRNAGVLNIQGEQSVSVAFYVETTFSLNAGLGLNSTPILLNPAIDLTAVIGQRFIHNPNAVDANGDSLAYRMTVSRKVDTDDRCVLPRDILGFVQPSEVGNGRNQAGTGAATITINPTTGDLIWDAPAVAGKYNVAFIVEEWRNGVKVSETIRDMQIEVRDADNRGPEITIPADICVEAGTRIEQQVRAADQPARSNRVDRLQLFATGPVFAQLAPIPNFINPALATFISTNPQNSPAIGLFTWQTGCQHIQDQTYNILFKAEDVPPNPTIPKLFDSKTWKVKIVAPKPKNVRSVFQPLTRVVQVTWDRYLCSSIAGAELIIYRREGCTNASVDVCKPSLPAGYVQIGRVPATQTSFDDKNIRPGVQYSYRVSGLFLQGNGSLVEGAVSDESCFQLPRTMSVITNVTVDKTDTQTGEITVKWTRPPFDRALVPGPYEYRLLRSTGQNTTAYSEVGRIPTALDTRADTVFTDKNLNTQANSYRYRVDLYYTENNALALFDSTNAAASVRLSATGTQRSVELSWVANVPWRNENQRHRVYREDRNRRGTFNMIAEVPVTTTATFRYLDNGTDNVLSDGNATIRLSADSSYCYRVETVGTYNDPKIKPDLLFNFSQVTCATPRDTVRPCPPVLDIEKLNCDTFLKDQSTCNQTTFSNKISWTDAIAAECDKEIVAYNVYFKRFEDDKFEKIATITTPRPPARTFVHTGLKSYAGYYVVTAVNRFGTESRQSNVVTNDNCPDYKLPNVFTPNGDGRNDTFTPLVCPRFADRVTVMIYNRFGSKVWEYSGENFNINWDGRTSGGDELPVGTYFYEITVHFATLTKDGVSQTYKGWVDILR
jgi:gliding motility-associated-like protein